MLRKAWINCWRVHGRRQLCRTFSVSWQQLSARVTVDKKLSLADEAINISIDGLKPSQDVTLHALTKISDGKTFESFSHYTADSHGSVSLHKAESKGGTYQGVEPMGPIWSMVASPFNKRKHERFLVKETSQPFIINFNILDGFSKSLEDIRQVPQNNVLTTSSVERTYSAPGVEEIEVLEGRIRATLFLPPGDGPFPGVISISGGIPGAMKHKGSLLASRGFAALTLRYFGTDDLPKEAFADIDLTYIEEAVMFLKNHPKVDGEKGISFFAACWGGNIALAYASVAPPGVLSSVVTINSWFYAVESFRYNERRWKRAPGLKGFGEEGFLLEGPEDSIIWNFAFDVDVTNPDNTLAYYKRHDISYLHVYGGEDGYIKSEQVAADAKTLLESSGHKNYDILFYPKAGHVIEHAYCPMSRFGWTFSELHYLGGDQPWHSKAEIDSYPKILSFIRDSLKRN